MPTSTFGRLFTYARDNKVDALENFTTEALAASIREDADPIIRLLQAMLLAPAHLDDPQVDVATQVGVAGAGVVDLVLDLRTAGGSYEFWIEVKVFAGESGRQLDNYATHIAALPGDQPRLVVLARYPLREAAVVPWMSWQSVWCAAGQAQESSTHWRELRVFLEEIRMADRFDSPVSAREAASLDGAAALLGKTKRWLASVAREANARWPAFVWPTDENKIRSKLGTQFARHGRYFIIAGESFRGYLLMGIVTVDDEAHASFWVETRDKAIEPRRQIIATADLARLSADWGREMGAWGGLHREERLVRLGSAEAIEQWFIECFEQLDAAGILALLPALGRAEPGEDTDDDGEVLS